MVSLSSQSLNFGDQLVGTTGPPQIITLTNTGPANLIVYFVSLGYYTYADFSETDTCTTAPIAPNGSCTIIVQFSPIYPGLRSDVLSITDNAADSPQDVSLMGNALYPALSYSAYGLAFGDQAVGVAAVAQNLTVTNFGNTSLTITNVAIAGTNAGDFGKTSDGCSGRSIGPNLTCTVGVNFTPSATGARDASLIFTDNAADSPQSLPLSGNGVFPVARINPSSLDFGDQQVGTTSASQSLTLSNLSTVPLTIKSVTIAGIAPSNFGEATTCTAAPLISNGQCVISITFVPSSGGHKSAVLSIADNAADSPQSVTLTGNAVVPTPTVSSNTASPTKTAVPSSTIGPTTTPAVATATATTTSGACAVHPAPPALSIHVASSAVSGGGTLPITILTAPHARVTITLVVVTTRVATTGKGAQRKRTVRKIDLYRTTRQGVADAHGRFVVQLKIAFQPATTLSATLSVQARTACASATRSTGVRLLPLTIALSPKRVVGGGVLTLTLHTGAGSQIDATLKVLASRVVETGTGKHRKRVTHTVVRYQLKLQGSADKGGHFVRRVHVRYNPTTPEQLIVDIAARMPRGTARGSASVTIVPSRARH
jgi:hypothetical protein